MRQARRIAGRSAWSVLATSVTIGLLAGSLAGCSTKPEPQALPTYGFDGVYRLVADGAEQTLGGQPDPGESMHRQYALRSHCDGDRCVNTGLRLDDTDTTKPFSSDEDDPMIADYRDGHWTQVEQTKWTCADGSIGHQTVVWLVTPQSDGTITGTRTDVRIASPACVSVRQFPFTLTRVGDIDPGISLADPAKVTPWRASPPERLSGRYTRTAVQVGTVGDIDRSTVEFSSYCVRNTNTCVALKSFTGPDGPVVVPMEFDNRRWTVQFVAPDMECPETKLPARVVSHEAYSLPSDAADPAQILTGSEVALVDGGCTGVMRDFNLALQRSEG